MKLDQRPPGSVALEKGVSALIAGLNDRDSARRWRVASPPDRLELAGAVRAGDVDLPGVVAPDDQDAVGYGGTARLAPDEDVANEPGEEVA